MSYPEISELGWSAGSLESNDEWSQEVSSHFEEEEEEEQQSSSESEDESGIPSELRFMNKPFHDGSSITLCTAILAIMKFCICNHLSYKAMDDLLKLLNLLCITPYYVLHPTVFQEVHIYSKSYF